MNYNLLDEAVRKHPKYEDAISELKTNLYVENAELTDAELKSRINAIVKKAANTRVREAKQFTEYRDPEVIGPGGVHRASELARVFPSRANATAKLIQDIRCDAVRLLPTNKRRLLEEYFEQGKTAKELIGRFGATEEAVRQAAKRAKDDLEALLKDENVTNRDNDVTVLNQ